MLHIHSQDGVTVLTLDRPERAHAYNRALLDALDAALSALADPVVVITSAGPAFCGGADLEEMAQADPLDALDMRSQAVFERLARAGAVSIAAVGGAAVAGGFELALACDLRVGGPEARFWLPETGLGLIPSAGGCTRLPRLVGGARARELVLTGRVLEAEEALAWGLLSRLHADPRGEALRWAQQLRRRDPVALRLAKQALDSAAPNQGSLDSERVAEALLYLRRRAAAGS